jgi:uncharacterized repeat protein (TIGR03803 family)
MGIIQAAVMHDAAGNLYGTTIAGGSPNGDCGVIFKLSPQPVGSWKYTLLHSYVGSDGKLYGTTATGGRHGGVVFQLTP